MNGHPRRSISIALLLALLTAVPASAGDRDGDGLRDRFERRGGVTNPYKRDTDGDGVIDSAEDNDRDRLSNLAEQRYGTHPGKKDSDGDGKSDGREDKDRDGISNAREQDHRRLPKSLRPTLSGSRKDVPRRKADCITAGGDSRIHPCVFGHKGSSITIVLFGDSHAFHWLPALEAAAKHAGWRVVTLAKGSCKSARPAAGTAPRTDCAKWRASAMRWINDHPPRAIILANAAPYLARSRNTWQGAIEDTLAALPAKSAKVVLSDTPRPPREVALCLRRHVRNMSACTFSRPSSRSFGAIKAEQAAAASGGALHASLFDKVCSYDPCPLVQGRLLIYRGVHHLTATIARQLSPSMRRVVVRALATRVSDAARP